jgi:hypothetical protein
MVLFWPGSSTQAGNSHINFWGHTTHTGVGPATSSTVTLPAYSRLYERISVTTILDRLQLVPSLRIMHENLTVSLIEAMTPSTQSDPFQTCLVTFRLGEGTLTVALPVPEAQYSSSSSHVAFAVTSFTSTPHQVTLAENEMLMF